MKGSSSFYKSQNNQTLKNGDTAQDFLIEDSTATVKANHAILKNVFKLSLLHKNGYKYNNQSKSNDDLSGQSFIEKDLRKSKCDIQKEENTPPSSPTSELWFKTWPDCCEKPKSNDVTPQHTNNTQFSRNKFTLNEALQNISLAYSPVTKQLHLVDNSNQKCDNYYKEDIGEDTENNYEQNTEIKKGHRRIQAGSFSSTISTLSASSNPSTTGSLLDSDDRPSSNFKDNDNIGSKKSITEFFTRNVFAWKFGNEDVNNDSTNSLSVWKLFGRSTNENSSPLHHVASSSALIQLKRPCTLPAKTLEEEQRHTEEYNAILAAAKKKEAKDTAFKQKQQKLQLQLEEQQAASAKHFVQQVLPKWDKMVKTKKTQELWWNGLPSSVRGKVWCLAIGNELNVTPQLYEICLTRAQTRLNSPEPPKRDYEADQESSMDVIELDISRTFPNLCIFQQGGPYSEVLHSLLAAYVCFRPDVGYVQGMSYIAAILILNMDACDAFICFANLLNQPLHLSAFTLDQEKMQAYYKAYDQIFSYNLPKLYVHFENSGLTPDLYLLDWIYTIYAKAMPLDVACRVWDIFLRDGCEFIFRTALGILHLYQSVLATMDFLHGAQFLTHLPEEMSSDQLFKSIQLVTTSIGKQCFSQIVEKFIKNSDHFS